MSEKTKKTTRKRRNPELMDAISMTREELDEYLHGLVICDEISSKEHAAELRHFDSWAKDADWGDEYCAEGMCFTIVEES